MLICVDMLCHTNLDVISLRVVRVPGWASEWTRSKTVLLQSVGIMGLGLSNEVSQRTVNVPSRKGMSSTFNPVKAVR